MLSSIIISVLLGATVLILIYWLTNLSTENNNESSDRKVIEGNVDDGKLSSSTCTDVKNYTATQVAEHVREDDAWIIVDGKVSDVNWPHSPLLSS